VLPADYQRIWAIVRGAAGPVKVKEVGSALGLPVQVRGKLEPLRGKLNKRADRGWLRKLADGRVSDHHRSTNVPSHIPLTVRLWAETALS
jgi:hypothetical protein